MPISLDFKIEDISETEIAGTFDEMLNTAIQLLPAHIIADSDHAAYLEYGTHPIGKGRGEFSNNYAMSARQSIEEWAMQKFQHLSIKDRKKLAHFTYQKLMNEGMPPHPFLRPAIDKVMDEVDPDWLVRGNSMLDIAEEIVTVAKQNLVEGNHNWNWDVYRSLYAIREVPYAPDMNEGDNEQ